MNGRRQTLRWVGVVVAVLVVLIGLWVGGHHVRSMAEPRWTTSDLPPPPPQADNAYRLLPFPGIASTTTDEMMSVVDAVDAGPAEHVWATLDPLVEELDTHTVGTTEALDDFRKRRRFVCDAPLLGESHALHALQVYRLAFVRVLVDHARAEVPGPVYDDLIRMWNQAYDYAFTCSDLVTCLVSLKLLELTVAAADAFAARSLSETDSERLADALAASDLESLSLRHALIREYLWTRVALGQTTGLLLDRAHTESMIARYIEDLLAYDAEPSAAAPDMDSLREGPLYWLHNPDGKDAFDMMLVISNLTMRIDTHRADRDDLITRRDEVVERLRSREASPEVAMREAACSTRVEAPPGPPRPSVHLLQRLLCEQRAIRAHVDPAAGVVDIRASAGDTEAETRVADRRCGPDLERLIAELPDMLLLDVLNDVDSNESFITCSDDSCTLPAHTEWDLEKRLYFRPSDDLEQGVVLTEVIQLETLQVRDDIRADRIRWAERQRTRLAAVRCL